MKFIVAFLFLIPFSLSSQAYVDSVYEFEVGDEFHYKLENTYNTLLYYRYTRNKIISKNITSSKIYYIIQSDGYIDYIGGVNTFFNSTFVDSFPVLDTIKDTIPPCLDSTHPYFDSVTSQFGNVNCYLIDTIYFDSSYNSLVYKISYNAIEHISFKIYAKGIGKVFDKDRTWTPIIETINELVYYKDSSTGFTWGTPVIFNVGLKEFKQLNFTVYPNPTTNFIQLNGLENSTNNFQLINSIGKAILTGKIESNQIDCSTLPSGIYFLKIINKTGSSGIKRIVISR